MNKLKILQITKNKLYIYNVNIPHNYLLIITTS